MNNFMKMLWTVISLTPLLFIVDLMLIADYFHNKTFCNDWTVIAIIAGIMVVLIFLCWVMILLAKKYVHRTSININEAETKDNEMAGTFYGYK